MGENCFYILTDSVYRNVCPTDSVYGNVCPTLRSLSEKENKKNYFEHKEFRSIIKDVVKCLKLDHAFLKELVTSKGIQYLHMIIPKMGIKLLHSIRMRFAEFS